MSTSGIPREEIFIENLSFRTEYSSARYHNLQCEQKKSVNYNCLSISLFSIKSVFNSKNGVFVLVRMRDDLF